MEERGERQNRREGGESECEREGVGDGEIGYESE